MAENTLFVICSTSKACPLKTVSSNVLQLLNKAQMGRTISLLHWPLQKAIVDKPGSRIMYYLSLIEMFYFLSRHSIRLQKPYELKLGSELTVVWSGYNFPDFHKAVLKPILFGKKGWKPKALPCQICTMNFNYSQVLKSLLAYTRGKQEMFSGDKHTWWEETQIISVETQFHYRNYWWTVPALMQQHLRVFLRCNTISQALTVTIQKSIDYKSSACSLQAVPSPGSHLIQPADTGFGSRSFPHVATGRNSTGGWVLVTVSSQCSYYFACI